MTEKNRFPKRGQAQSTGEIGVGIVASSVRTNFGWEFRRTPQESDFGVDGYIDIVTEDGYVTGKSVAVQIKTGGSYFEEKVINGWRFRGKIKHVNYYLNMAVPVVILLVDPDTLEVWWCLFEAYEIDRTKAGFSIVVPSQNKFGEASKNVFQQIAGVAVDYIAHLEEFWMLPERVKEQPICVQVQRFEVEGCVVRPFQRVLERLSVSRSVAISAMNKVDFVIDGYNDDPREVFEIPAVQNWVHLMLGSVKSICFFLELGPTAQGINTIIACVGSAEVVSKTGDQTVLALCTPERVLDFIDEQFRQLNEFAESNMLGEESIQKVSMRLSEKIMSFPILRNVPSP